MKAFIALRTSCNGALEAQMTYGDRKASRVSFERGIHAHIMGIDGTWSRECMVADVSATGAKLIVPGAIGGLNLREFFLLLTATGSAFRRCELIRVNGDEIGIRFLKKPVAGGKACRPSYVPKQNA
jgi:PilZ domain-containing protein